MLKIKRDQCIGCGLCASLCPDVFEMDEDYKALIISDKNKNGAKLAATSCPVNAISI